MATSKNRQSRFVNLRSFTQKSQALSTPQGDELNSIALEAKNAIPLVQKKTSEKTSISATSLSIVPNPQVNLEEHSGGCLSSLKSDTKILTVIIPVRVSKDRTDAAERLQYQLEDSIIPSGIEFLVIDDGSDSEWSSRIKIQCDDFGFKYKHLETGHKKFSFSRCRNEGVSASRTPYVMFLDVDLVPYAGFYRDVLNEIKIRKLDSDASEFLMFGVIYLTRNATNEFFATTPDLRRQTFMQALFDNDLTRIEKFSTGTSVTVYSRPWFMAHGGNDNEFEGWGYEDLEFNCRMLRLSKRFPLPDSFKTDYRNFKEIVEYKGWKSVYRLFGDSTFQKGIVLFHAWHDVNKESDYMGRNIDNRKLFEHKMDLFARQGIEPLALPMPEHGRSIMFTNTVPFVFNRLTAPYFGEITVLNPDKETPASIVTMIKSGKSDRVIFFNPYGKASMLNIYKAVREHKIPYYVCERGALRDSLFIDPNGFNAESTSYDSSKWDVEIDCARIKRAEAYIEQERIEDDSLEKQPERLGAAELRRRHNLDGKKILFVPFQRPSDTVIEFFCGEIKTYDNFVALVQYVAAKLPSNWVVVCKRHPLEIADPKLSSVMWLNEGNIKDLLEIANSVLLINSGVGLLSLMAGNQTIAAGKAFYGQLGLAKSLSDPDQVVDYILNGEQPERNKVLRFVSYLIEDFYSFGKFSTREIDWKDGAKMTATGKIDLYQVRVPGAGGYNRRKNQEVTINRDSILFDRYRVAMSMNLSVSGSKPPMKPIAAAIAKEQHSESAVLLVSEEFKSVANSSESLKIATIKNSLVTESSNKLVQTRAISDEKGLLDLSCAYPVPHSGDLSKKLRKMVREPKRFFDESKFGVLRQLGTFIK